MTDALAILDRKKALRVRALVARAQAAAGGGGAAASALAARVAALAIPAGSVVAGYWPLGDEIDPLPLMEALAQGGCRLALPVVTGPDEALEFRSWEPGAALEEGSHGTRHPLPSAATVVPTVVLVPLLAFDARGFRLGYGGGYYDRTLAPLREAGGVVAIGLAYAAQQVPDLPVEGWDQRLDRIVTERGVIEVELG